MPRSFSTTGTTIVDTAADIPTASAAYEGVMVFQKDTNELKICDGSVWRSVIDTDTPGGLVLISPTSVGGAGVSVSNGVVTMSAASTININGVFTSAFKNYRVVWNFTSGLSSPSNNRFFLRSAGADYSSNYYNSLWYLQGTTFITTADSNVANSEWLFYHADLLSSGWADINQPAEATTTNMVGMFNAWGSGSNIRGMGMVWQYAVRQYDGFSLVTQGGSSLTGTLRIYGYRDSI